MRRRRCLLMPWNTLPNGSRSIATGPLQDNVRDFPVAHCIEKVRSSPNCAAQHAPGELGVVFLASFESVGFSWPEAHDLLPRKGDDNREERYQHPQSRGEDITNPAVEPIS